MPNRSIVDVIAKNKTTREQHDALDVVDADRDTQKHANTGTHSAHAHGHTQSFVIVVTVVVDHVDVRRRSKPLVGRNDYHHPCRCCPVFQ